MLLQAYASARQKFLDRTIPADLAGTDDGITRAGALPMDGKARLCALLKHWVILLDDWFSLILKLAHRQSNTTRQSLLCRWLA